MLFHVTVATFYVMLLLFYITKVVFNVTIVLFNVTNVLAYKVISSLATLRFKPLKFFVT